MLDGQDSPDTASPPRPGSRTGPEEAGRSGNSRRTGAGSTGHDTWTDGTWTDGTRTDGTRADDAGAAGSRCGPRETARTGLEDWLDVRHRDPLAEMHGWALLPPGKLLRPVLLLESAAAVGGSPEQVGPAATGFELMHAGSLIHDDIIDGDELRRGREATHCRYGVDRAVVGADSLFFAVFETLGECRQRGVADRLISDATAVIAKAGLDITRGATLELDLSGELHDDTDMYLEMARLKTAALLSAACRTGAVLADGTPEQTDALTEFGEALGIAFQIQDDLLPYARPRGNAARAGSTTPAGDGSGAGTGSAPAADSVSAADGGGSAGPAGPAGSTAGKSRTSDLRNKRPVLPLLLAHRNGSDADRALLAELREGGADEQESRQERLHRLLETTGALEAAQHTADNYLDRCRKALEVLPPSPHRQRLATLADQYTSRGDE